jgi:NSS family neurotransmitter:Na+ symporter
VTSAWFITITDVSVALLAGLVIFPIVFTHGLEPTLGAELAFSTLPEAFDRMTGGECIAVAFFALISLAALTSAVSMLEANVAAVTEAVGLSRPATAGILTLALIVLGLPAALSYSSLDLEIRGTRVLDLMDDTLGTMGLPLGALILGVTVAWWGPADIFRRASPGARMRDRFVQASLLLLNRYVIPPVLIVIGGSRLLSSAGFSGWHVLPGGALLGRLDRDIALLVMVPLLLVATLAVVAVLRTIRRATIGEPASHHIDSQGGRR